MKTGSLLLALLLFFISTLSAQDKQAIISSGRYYYGSGTSFDEKEARDRALEELTQQIAVRVAQSFTHKVKESSKGLKEEVRSILKTHSAATLKNVQMIKTPQPGGEINVFCYIPKNEVSRIFAERKQLIYDMFRKAEHNETIANYGYALKLYYFAQILMNSVPDQNIVVNGINLTLEIPDRINRIIQHIRFQKVEDRFIAPDEREITLTVRYDERPVSLLDFMFWDGNSQQQVTARDGLATFRLLGASVHFKKLQVAIKYAYYDARNEFQVIAELWPVVEKAVYSNEQTISLNTGTPLPATVNNIAGKNWNLKLTYKGNVPVAQNITRSTVQFLDLLARGDTDHIRRRYGNDPFLRDKILNYIKYNHPEPLDKTIKATVHKTTLGYELRRIRVFQNYPSLHKQSTEYLVLDFDHKGNLIDLNASISENLYQTFVRQSEFGHDWKERQQIIKFIEKYRTSYLIRDLKTIDLMFAEDALIIVGRKIKRKKLPEDLKPRYRRFEKQPDYEYIRLTKEKYLQRLQRVFEAQQDIFLDFSSFRTIRKNNTKGVYGVEMRQSYQSTTYSDEGYLFLLIDFRGADPLIYVRAWQPNEWNDSVLVRTANFRIYK